MECFIQPLRADIMRRLEGSHSGRVRYLGKVVYLYGYREFESLSLRQDIIQYATYSVVKNKHYARHRAYGVKYAYLCLWSKKHIKSIEKPYVGAYSSMQTLHMM